MKKKIIIPIILIIIVLGGLYLYEENYLKGNAKIEKTYFEIPAGFHEVKGDDIINLTDGNTSIFIRDHKHRTVEKGIQDYKDMKGENYTLNVTRYNVGNITVSKGSCVDEPTTLHYWYVDNGDLYEIYTWTANNNTDDVVSGLISSMRFFYI
ncbi:MAG: hypothetical protein IJP12_02340 [Methanobrevibacter sp.]|nr:hypothetical protein [Methanobrevibacter sp.]